MRSSVLIPVTVLIRIIQVLRITEDPAESRLRSPSFLAELQDLDAFLTAKLQAVKNAAEYEARIKNKPP